MRDLGAVLDHEKLLPIGMRSIAPAKVRTRHGRALMIL